MELILLTVSASVSVLVWPPPSHKEKPRLRFFILRLWMKGFALIFCFILGVKNFFCCNYEFLQSDITGHQRRLHIEAMCCHGFRSLKAITSSYFCRVGAHVAVLMVSWPTPLSYWRFGVYFLDQSFHYSIFRWSRKLRFVWLLRLKLHRNTWA